MKKYKTLALRVAVSVGSLALVTYMARGRFMEALASLAAIDVWPLLAALALNFISLVPVTIRSIRILKVQGVDIRFGRMYHLWAISLFFNLFLPSAVGGDFVKAYYLAKDSGKKLAAVSSVLIDRFFGLMATIAIGMCAFILARHHINNPRIGHMLFWFAVAVAVMILFMMSRRFSRPIHSILLKLTPKRFHQQLHRLFQVFDLYRVRRLDFFISFAISIAAQSLFIFLVYLLARSIDMNLPLGVFFLFMPIIAVSSMTPSIGGLGPREFVTLSLFRHYAPEEKAIAFYILIDLFTYGIGATCGVWYAFRGGAPIKEIEKIEESSERGLN